MRWSRICSCYKHNIHQNIYQEPGLCNKVEFNHPNWWKYIFLYWYYIFMYKSHCGKFMQKHTLNSQLFLLVIRLIPKCLKQKPIFLSKLSEFHELNTMLSSQTDWQRLVGMVTSLLCETRLMVSDFVTERWPGSNIPSKEGENEWAMQCGTGRPILAFISEHIASKKKRGSARGKVRERKKSKFK